MKRLRLLPIALAAALAGCGGGETSGAGAGADGASVTPANATAFVSIDTDLSSNQWKTVDSLLDKFPGKERLLTQLRESFERDAKVRWTNDVKPALGRELDVVVLNLDAGAKVVALTQPKDDGKFDTLVRKLNASEEPDERMATGEFEGWKLIADESADIDTFKRAASGAKLADDGEFQDALDALDDEALVKAYVDTPQLVRKLREMVPTLDATAGSMARRLSDLRAATAELVARDDGLEVTGRIVNAGKPLAKNYKAAFVDDVPAGALVFLSFHGQAATANLGSGANPALPAAPELAPLLGALRRLTPLFANENAFYILPGFPIPEVTLLTQPKNLRRAQAAVTALVASLRPLLGQTRIRTTALDGVPAREVDFGRFSVYYGVLRNRFFVSTSQRIVRELGDTGQKLADDATFKEAMDAAGMPDATFGFLYVNLKDSIPLVESLAQLSGARLPPDVDANLRHLRTFLAYASGEPHEARFTAFLGVG